MKKVINFEKLLLEDEYKFLVREIGKKKTHRIIEYGNKMTDDLCPIEAVGIIGLLLRLLCNAFAENTEEAKKVVEEITHVSTILMQYFVQTNVYAKEFHKAEKKDRTEAYAGITIN